MRFVFGILGCIASFLMIKYREKVGDMIGEGEWMQKVGGVYNLIIILGIFFFLWSLSYLTDTTSFFFSPLKYLIPGLIRSNGAGAVM